MTIDEMFKDDLKRTKDLNKLKVEISRFDNRPNRVLESSGEKIYRVSEKDYEYFSSLIEEEKRNRQQDENIQKRNNSQYIDEGMRDTNAIFRGRERDEAINNYSRNEKRNIKHTPSKKRKIKKQKNKNGKRISVIIATMLLIGGFAAKGIALNQNTEEYNETVKAVEGLTYEEIKELAENEFIQAISEDISVDKDDINISQSHTGTSTNKTKITISEGEEETQYSLTIDSRDPVSWGSMSGNISNIISTIRSSKDEREAINGLMKERDFIKNNKIKRENGKLTTEKRTSETRSEGTQDMDEYTL